jgi:hypothetical protein
MSGRDLPKCVAKIEKNQLKDGSWNIAGGWAPILGTSMASQSLFKAQQEGVAVSEMAMGKIEEYTKLGTRANPWRRQRRRNRQRRSRGNWRRVIRNVRVGRSFPLQGRTGFVAGFGSIGGEEFFSYLNISDSLHRTGGPDWETLSSCPQVQKRISVPLLDCWAARIGRLYSDFASVEPRCSCGKLVS